MLNTVVWYDRDQVATNETDALEQWKWLEDELAQVRRQKLKVKAHSEFNDVIRKVGHPVCPCSAGLHGSRPQSALDDAGSQQAIYFHLRGI